MRHFTIDTGRPARFLLGGFLRYGRGYRHIDRGPLEDTEVFLIEEGTLFISIDGTRHAAPKGTVLINPPGTIQKGFRSSPEPIRDLWFHCDISIDTCAGQPQAGKLRELLAQPRRIYGGGAPGTREIVVPEVSGPRRWGALLHLAYAICENRPCFEGEKNALVSAFFHMLSADALTTGPSDAERPGSVVARVKDHIDQNVDNRLQVRQLRVDTVAAHFDLHPVYLAFLFKRETGMSVHAYIMHQRIALACRFLSQGFSVREVATHAGFGNAEYFAQAFKGSMRQTPSEYRRSVASL